MLSSGISRNIFIWVLLRDDNEKNIRTTRNIYGIYNFGVTGRQVEQDVRRFASRTRTQMKMLRGVQNERFTFEIDTEKALVGCTLER